MSYMAKVYAHLIRKKEKSLEDVPEKLKVEVQQLLHHEETESD